MLSIKVKGEINEGLAFILWAVGRHARVISSSVQFSRSVVSDSL